MIDPFGRNIDYMRLSITDRCNLNCSFCNPKNQAKVYSNKTYLSFNEIIRICKIMSDLGIKKIKITGGEPLLRKDFLKILNGLKELSVFESITITTNGTLFEEYAETIFSLGIDSVTFSLDTLSSEKFFQITGKDSFSSVISGIKKAITLGFNSVKINFTAIKELNCDEILNIADFCKKYPVSVRFIELMPLGFGKTFSPIYTDEIKKILENTFGSPKEYSSSGNGPAKYFLYPDFKGKIGFISPLSEPFCTDCNKIRLSSEGSLRLCLGMEPSFSLHNILQEGLSDDEIKNIILEKISEKPLNHNFFKNFSEKKKMYSIGG